MKKNDEILIEIIAVANEGNGIGKYNGITVFVPFAVPGDVLKVKIVKVKSNFCFGKTIEIIKPSKLRIKSDCDNFEKCGGCIFRNISYETELLLKQQRVYDAMLRIGKIDINCNTIIGGSNTLRYRNKAQCPVSVDGNVGFYALRSHRVIPFNNGTCLLQPRDFDSVIELLSIFFKEKNVSCYNEITKQGIIRHIYMRKAFATGEIMVVIVVNSNNFSLENAVVELLKKHLGDHLKTVVINFNTQDTNVILGKEQKVIYGEGYITDILCSVKIRISPYSFYQVNREMAQILYEKAKEYAQPNNKTVLDLYCGAGTIGLSMANSAKQIIGVEIVEQAVEDAKFNAKNNNIDNAMFICDDASGAAKELALQKVKPEVVIVDPPRKGCDKELLNTIANDFSPERLVYVSCDPATLARDCAILNGLGYCVLEYTPVDLFPRTEHVETVCLLERKKS